MADRTPTIEPIAVDVRGAAQALAVSPRTIEAMAARGDLPSFRVGRRRLFEVEALKQWTARQTAEAAKGGAQ